MRAGRLRHYITFQKVPYTQDSTGGSVAGTAVEICKVYGDWHPMGDRGGGREVWAARQLNAEAIGVWEIYWRNDITPGMQIVWGTRVFELTGPPTEGAGRNWNRIMFVPVKEING